MTKGEAIIRESSDGLLVSYEDFDVECFGGSDYEVTYLLDRSGREKLRKALVREGLSGTLEEMILAHFGACLDLDSFADYCDRLGIRYKFSTWIS